MEATEVNPVDYHFDEDKIKAQVMESLKGHKPYQKLYKQLGALDPMRDFVKREYIKAQLREYEEKEIHRFVELEEKRRMNVNVIGDMLEQLSPEDGHKYQVLMTSMAFCIDMLDYIIGDINGLLRRNNIGVEMFHFDELKKAKDMVSDLADGEINNMPEYKQNEYVPACDELLNTVKTRADEFCQKMNLYEETHQV